MQLSSLPTPNQVAFGNRGHTAPFFDPSSSELDMLQPVRPTQQPTAPPVEQATESGPLSLDWLAAEVAPIYADGVSRITAQMDRRMDDVCNKSIGKTFHQLRNTSDSSSQKLLMLRFYMRVPGMLIEALKIKKSLQSDIKKTTRDTNMSAERVMTELLNGTALTNTEKKQLKELAKDQSLLESTTGLKQQLKNASLYTPTYDDGDTITVSKKKVVKQQFHGGYCTTTLTARASVNAKVNVNLTRYT